MSLKRIHFSWYWAIWIGLLVVGEAAAVLSGVDRATLSSHVRDWLRHQPLWVWIFFLIFFIWLTIHFTADLRK